LSIVELKKEGSLQYGFTFDLGYVLRNSFCKKVSGI